MPSRAPSVSHSGSSASLALRSHSATSIADMAPFISPSLPPLKTKSTIRCHKPTTERGSSPSIKWNKRSTARLPIGAMPEMSASVLIQRTAPPAMSSPTGPLASPIGRSISIS